jgi:hypothetical protein
MKNKAKGAVLGAVLAASVVSAPGVASAGVCDGGYVYDITSSSDIYFPASITYKDGPGGSMTVSVTNTSTKTSSGSVTAGATLGGIIAQAKIEVSSDISTSNSVTVGHSYTRNITAGRYGNAQYVAWGKQVYWSYFYEYSNCTRVRKASGIAKLVRTAEGWRYWETTS